MGGECMSQHILVELEMPTDLEKFRLPQGVDERLQALLDRQDRGAGLTPAERAEAEGLVDLAELLALLRLRTQRVWQEGSHGHELYSCRVAATRRAKGNGALPGPRGPAHAQGVRSPGLPGPAPRPGRLPAGA